MMELQENHDRIYTGVIRCIERATGLAPSQISLHKTLIGDLKIDSIDMIDLLYQLEDEFGIEIKVGEMEHSARAQLGDKPFAVDNIITPDGLVILKEMMPEVDSSKLTSGLMVQQIPYLFTVQSMCRLVNSKLKSA